MSYQAGRPENVLRRAEDLIAINQSDIALQSLYTFITAKRTKHIEPTNPQLIEIFKLFIKLAINERLTKDIKDALYQYKKMIQSTSSDAAYAELEQLAKFFLISANAKLADAQTKANDAAEVAIEENYASAAAAQKVIDTLDDVDNQDEEEEDVTFNISPENILLSSVTTDDSTERSNKEFFLPWLKFAWEAHRTVLELLRGSSKLETAYCQAILQCFQFCVKYDRKSEFKRLCEILKLHLQSMAKQEHEDSVNLSNPETLQKLLDTRFQQLNTAVKLELWKESFKSIEDVHGLMKLYKRAPKPISLVNYYNNLAKIFQVSNDYVYATAARQKLFQLLIQSPVITDAELKQNATLYLITALSIPVLESFNQSFAVENGLIDDEFYKKKNNKFSALLNLNEIPTRESLLNSSTLKTVLKYADNEIVSLYNLIEKSFNPITFHTKANSTISYISNNDIFAPFINALKETIISKVVSKVAVLYDSIKLDFFYKLISFSSEEFNIDEFTFEDLLVSGQYASLIKANVEIDDESGVVSFTDKIYVTEGSKVNSRLYDIENALSSAMKLVNLQQGKDEEKELQAKLLKIANEDFENEKETILNTANLIKKREIELIEAKKREAEENEQKRIEMALKAKQAEEERIANDTELREKMRLEKIRKTIEIDNKKKLVETINASDIIHINFEDVKDMSEDDIRALQISKLDEQAKKLEEQVTAVVKRQDYIERAQRQVEIPLLKKEIDEEIAKQKESYEATKAKNLEQAKAAHEIALKTKERLSKFVNVYKTYAAQLEVIAKEANEARTKKAKAAFEAEKEARIAEFVERKKQEFMENKKREAEEAKVRAEAERARAEQLKVREAAAKRREEAYKAQSQAPSQAPIHSQSQFQSQARGPSNVDSGRQAYELLKAKPNKSFSDKIKLKEYAKIYGP
ncbi:hypothetical protein CANINC_000533 [Pichia inconspicua]|uniref:PCI domain-containing protein n=1 Tax=Pichia inconspicua TaxID=52247 RepID=A0A4T0X6D4_9ASCO|nr:hypothetical protein CANINC_000533 [[Candida] inconspicua]